MSGFQEQPGRVSRLTASRENVLNSLHEAVMDVQSLILREKSQWYKDSLRNLETALLGAYRCFEQLADEMIAESQEDALAQYEEEQEIRKMQREKL